MNADRQFLDTNVAVYAYDAAEPAKQAVRSYAGWLVPRGTILR